MTDDKTEPDEPEECSAGERAFWGVIPSEPEMFVVGEDAPPSIDDWEERTARFGEEVIRFVKKIPFNAANNRLIDQLVGAATSVGANYGEADDGVSRADFRHRIGRKEARETKCFLRMISTAEPGLKPEARELWKEARSLHLISSRVWRSTTP